MKRFASILILALACTFLNGLIPRYNFRVYAIGTPDAFGNVIMNLTVHQWNGSAYEELLFWDNDTNWEVRVEPNLPINLTLWVRLNNTLAASEAEAITYTQILCNITAGIWTNEEFNNTGQGSDANYYYCQEQGHWNQSGYPVSGTDYTVVTRYEAYY